MLNLQKPERKPAMKKMLLLLFGLAAVWSVAAKVTLPDAIGSNMVLQQNTDVKLWGWADPHAAVKVEASWGAKASAKSDGEGRWEVTLKTPCRQLRTAADHRCERRQAGIGQRADRRSVVLQRPEQYGYAPRRLLERPDRGRQRGYRLR